MYEIHTFSCSLIPTSLTQEQIILPKHLNAGCKPIHTVIPDDEFADCVCCLWNLNKSHVDFCRVVSLRVVTKHKIALSILARLSRHKSTKVPTKQQVRFKRINPILA